MWVLLTRWQICFWLVGLEIAKDKQDSTKYSDTLAIFERPPYRAGNKGVDVLTQLRVDPFAPLLQYVLPHRHHSVAPPNQSDVDSGDLCNRDSNNGEPHGDDHL